MGCNCNNSKKLTKNTKSGKPHHKIRSFKSKPVVNRQYKPVMNKQQYIQPKKGNDIYFVVSDYKHLSQNDLRSWDRIHKMAIDATTPQKQLEFKKYMKYLSFYFPCPKCTPHIKSYLKTNPIMSEVGEKGFGRWSWKFQNSVNSRSGKKIFSWEEFRAKYNPQ